MALIKQSCVVAGRFTSNHLFVQSRCFDASHVSLSSKCNHKKCLNQLDVIVNFRVTVNAAAANVKSDARQAYR